jgi:hypothetical protein
VELAPVACAPVARARRDIVCGCCVRMISLLDRIWGWVIMTFAAMALATANFHEAMAMAEHFGVGRGRHPEDFWTAESDRWRLSCHLASSGSRRIGVSVDDRSESSNGISRRKQNRHSCVVEHSNRKQGVSNVRYKPRTPKLRAASENRYRSAHVPIRP